jgi:hypothetical protein
MKVTGTSILIIVATDKNKTIRVYDMDNEIISYQAGVADVLGEYVVGSTIHLLLKSTSSKTIQTLREKSSAEKLELFIKKKHFDVAYLFATNEKFSEDVRADICHHNGDFLHSKVPTSSS